MEEQQAINVAIQSLAKDFHRNPHIFLTEADVQCYLYYLLLLQNKKFKTLHNTTIDKGYKDKNYSNIKYKNFKGKNRKTIYVHAEIAGYPKTSIADITITKPENIIVTPRDNRGSKTRSYPQNLLNVYGYDLGKKSATGIEIKFNRGDFKNYDDMPKKKRKNLAKLIKHDLEKLAERYRNRYFIFVDKEIVFDTNAKFEQFIKKDCKFKKWLAYKAYYIVPTDKEKIRIMPINVGKRQ